MPRPSKHVSPDTLGGHIRATREQLHLSLADVANGHYSTSFISQIERNRVEPSQESLRFLAERLNLPLADLEALARQDQHREVEAHHFKSYDELRITATQLLAEKNTHSAIALLKDLHFPQVPPMQRWRLAALRGQCYFAQRIFLKAQQDFVYAVNESPRPESLPAEQRQDLLLLHLFLAKTYRELQQLDAALEQYTAMLEFIGHDTPFGYVAEAHWGIALIAYTQAAKLPQTAPSAEQTKLKTLQHALEHAQNAHVLYRAIGEQLRAAAVTCQIGLIEQALGNVEKVQASLKELLNSWLPFCTEPLATDPRESHRQREIASIVSAAACELAGIALEKKQYAQALLYVEQALLAGKRSYKLRRANAYLMRGRILEALDPYNPDAEAAFHAAIDELSDTQRVAARISAHVHFGRHLLRIGKIEAGEQELEQAHRLSDLVSLSSHSSQSVEDVLPL